MFFLGRATQLVLDCFHVFLVMFTAGVPNIRWCGVEGDYNVLVLDLLGPSLEDLFNFCSGKFSLKTALMLADQMVSTCTFFILLMMGITNQLSLIIVLVVYCGIQSNKIEKTQV